MLTRIAYINGLILEITKIYTLKLFGLFDENQVWKKLWNFFRKVKRNCESVCKFCFTFCRRFLFQCAKALLWKPSFQTILTKDKQKTLGIVYWLIPIQQEKHFKT